MLTIRAAQFESLEQARMEHFRFRMLRLLGGGDRAASIVDQVLSSAGRFGLVSEVHLTRLIELLGQVDRHGAAGDLLPRPALAILCAYGPSPEEKLARFAEWARQSQ